MVRAASEVISASKPLKTVSCNIILCMIFMLQDTVYCDTYKNLVTLTISIHSLRSRMTVYNNRTLSRFESIEIVWLKSLEFLTHYGSKAYPLLAVPKISKQYSTPFQNDQPKHKILHGKSLRSTRTLRHSTQWNWLRHSMLRPKHDGCSFSLQLLTMKNFAVFI